MFSIARRWTHCAADAEDLLQDVLLRFWVAFGVLPWEHEQPEWVQAVCRRWVRFRAAELNRKASVQQEIPLGEEDCSSPCDHCGSETSIIEHVDNQLLLQQLTDLLSPQQQKMLRLYLDGYTYQEIARELNVCLGTVKRQFSRIHQKAQAVLSTFWGAESELRNGGNNADDGKPIFPLDENMGGGN
jgi:RNA polymerase sigma-70 factor (ECF subfamily)